MRHQFLLKPITFFSLLYIVDSETKSMKLNTSYGPVIDSLIADDLAEKKSIMNIVIKQDEILTMSPHDPDVFSRFSSDT